MPQSTEMDAAYVYVGWLEQPRGSEQRAEEVGVGAPVLRSCSRLWSSHRKKAAASSSEPGGGPDHTHPEFCPLNLGIEP